MPGPAPRRDRVMIAVSRRGTRRLNNFVAIGYTLFASLVRRSTDSNFIEFRRAVEVPMTLHEILWFVSGSRIADTVSETLGFGTDSRTRISEASGIPNTCIKNTGRAYT